MSLQSTSSVDYFGGRFRAVEHHHQSWAISELQAKRICQEYGSVYSDSLFATVHLGKLSFKATRQFLCSCFYPLVILKLRKKNHVRKIVLHELKLKQCVTVNHRVAVPISAMRRFKCTSVLSVDYFHLIMFTDRFAFK